LRIDSFIQVILVSATESDDDDDDRTTQVLSIVSPSGFVARPELDLLLAHAREHSNSNPVIVLRSGDGVPGGTGKTTLARALACSDCD
jgi:hypothetical protein